MFERAGKSLTTPRKNEETGLVGLGVRVGAILPHGVLNLTVHMKTFLGQNIVLANRVLCYLFWVNS